MIRLSDRTDLFVDQQVLFESNKLQKKSNLFTLDINYEHLNRPTKLGYGGKKIASHFTM